MTKNMNNKSYVFISETVNEISVILFSKIYIINPTEQAWQNECIIIFISEETEAYRNN